MFKFIAHGGILRKYNNTWSFFLFIGSITQKWKPGNNKNRLEQDGLDQADTLTYQMTGLHPI